MIIGKIIKTYIEDTKPSTPKIENNEKHYLKDTPLIDKIKCGYEYPYEYINPYYDEERKEIALPLCFDYYERIYHITIPHDVLKQAIKDIINED